MHRNGSVALIRKLAFWIVLSTVGFGAATAIAADARVEREVRALQKSAIQQDNLNMNYGAAVRKLQTAAARCGASRCSPAVKAAVLRDLGAMQALSGAIDESKASFARALQLDPSLDLDPAYRSPNLEQIWDSVKNKAEPEGGGPAPAAAPAPAQAGDFTHTPPAQALVRTPLAIYVEYPGGDVLGRVLVKYKGAAMTEWKAVDLKKVGDGYGGLIPCQDVAQGTMQYFIQGFDAHGQPLAMSGSRTAPFTVEITSQISGAEPSLPGHSPPSQCGGEEASSSGAPDCPPDFPGCKAPKKEVGSNCSGNDECSTGLCSDGRCAEKKEGGEDCETDVECTSGSCSDGKCSDKKGAGDYCERDDDCASDHCDDSKCVGGPSTGFRRVWIGLGVQADLYVMPGAPNACLLNPTGTKTVNGANYNCVDPPPANTNFPASMAENNAIAGGAVQSGLKFGNLRILASVDYALTPNVLLGLHGGYVLFTDPATGKPGAAFAPLHVEARFTYLFGHNAIASPSFVNPLVLAAAGLGEFDAFVPVTVDFDNSMAPRPENAWLTAGPVFLAAGGGVRLKFGPGVAAIGALKLEGAFGGTAGFLFGVAPEVGVEFGL